MLKHKNGLAKAASDLGGPRSLYLNGSVVPSSRIVTNFGHKSDKFGFSFSD